VPQDLSQTNKIISVIRKELMGHCVAKQMGVELHADNRAVLVAQSPDSSIRQRPPLADEKPLALHTRSGLQVGLQSTAGW